MRLSRLMILTVMLIGFSNHAGACIINLGCGSLYIKDLTIADLQNPANNYPSPSWAALHMNSALIEPETGHLRDADLSEAVSKVSFLNNLSAAVMSRTYSYWLEHSGREQNNTTPVPEPTILLLLGSGLLGLAGFVKRI